LPFDPLAAALSADAGARFDALAGGAPARFEARELFGVDTRRNGARAAADTDAAAGRTRLEAVGVS
jgi:hypothetical protein